MRLHPGHKTTPKGRTSVKNRRGFMESTLVVVPPIILLTRSDSGVDGVTAPPSPSCSSKTVYMTGQTLRGWRSAEAPRRGSVNSPFVFTTKAYVHTTRKSSKSAGNHSNCESAEAPSLRCCHGLYATLIPIPPMSTGTLSGFVTFIAMCHSWKFVVGRTSNVEASRSAAAIPFIVENVEELLPPPPSLPLYPPDPDVVTVGHASCGVPPPMPLAVGYGTVQRSPLPCPER
mmetsp:Transcript_2046/g.4935  ORF Transcript_2046/g.4935 Transcript_2046/m.4935 type:complete len:230 (+) Transcript_2046:1873-2562(+)